MAASKTVQVPHLGGIKAGYALANDTYDPSKPTCVLINSMCMTVSLYQAQFQDPQLTAAMNLLAIEPLGHGSTSCAAEHFTYWDTAIMALQVMDQLGIKQAFALGTSQGGWMVARMALLAPDRVRPPPSSASSYEGQNSPRTVPSADPADPRNHAVGRVDGLRVRRLPLQGLLGPGPSPDALLPEVDQRRAHAGLCGGRDLARHGGQLWVWRARNGRVDRVLVGHAARCVPGR